MITGILALKFNNIYRNTHVEQALIFKGSSEGPAEVTSMAALCFFHCTEQSAVLAPKVQAGVFHLVSL